MSEFTDFLKTTNLGTKFDTSLFRGVIMKKWGEDTWAVQRLQGLIKDQYGKNIFVRPLTGLQSGSDSENFHFESQDLHIPLMKEESFLGTAVIPEAKDLSQDEALRLAETVRLILIPALYADFLERKENNLLMMSQVENSKENLASFDGLIADDDIRDESVVRQKLTSNIIHLNGGTDEQQKKIALQIHELAHRWAFIPLKDMEINSIYDLKKLGAVSLLVEKIENIDFEVQKLLLEYLCDPLDQDDPLLIVTSSLSIKEIEETPFLLPQLKDELFVNQFEVERAPLNYQNLKAVLEMFFFN